MATMDDRGWADRGEGTWFRMGRRGQNDRRREEGQPRPKQGQNHSKWERGEEVQGGPLAWSILTLLCGARL